MYGLIKEKKNKKKKKKERKKPVFKNFNY